MTPYILEKPIGPKVGNHAVGVVKGCPCCNTPHDVDDCAEYLAKSLDERNKFLFQQRLCFPCYKKTTPEHRARTCTMKRICKGLHPTGLHGYIPAVKGFVTVSHSTLHQTNIISMTVVPVLLKHRRNPEKEVLVYAMLDNCSQGTFIGDVLQLLTDADAEMRRTVITVKTLTGESIEDSTAVEGLLVSPSKDFADLHAPTKSIELPVTYSRTKLPIDQEDIHTPEKLYSWKTLISGREGDAKI